MWVGDQWSIDEEFRWIQAFPAFPAILAFHTTSTTVIKKDRKVIFKLHIEFIFPLRFLY